MPVSLLTLLPCVGRRLAALLVVAGCASPLAAASDSAPPSPSPGTVGGGLITLSPVQGEMICYADVPSMPGQRFALGVPETIGCRERMMLLNFPEVKGRLVWAGPDSAGALSTGWTSDLVVYGLAVVPGIDHVDVEITVSNLDEEDWSDVFALNCLNPVRAPMFKDWNHERTYMSMDGRPVPLAGTNRNPGRRPKVTVFLPAGLAGSQAPPFVTEMGGISPDRTDGNWLVSLSDPPGSYIAATSERALFLFTNQDRCCIHSAACFGVIPAGESRTARSRLYFGRGGLDDVLKRVGG